MSKTEYALSLRRTFKYTDGWDSEDAWQDIGTYRLLRAGPPKYDERGDGKSWGMTILVRSAASRADVERAIRNSFRSSCRCEHDCCGHWSIYAEDARPTKRGEWYVRMRGYQNV